MRKPHVVGIGGTTRGGSSTERAVRFTLAACEAEGATTTFFGGPEIAAFPPYAPENPDRVAGARRLVDELRRADGIILGSPGYHGSISGLVKNAIDYTEDMRADAEPYFAGRAVGCIVTGAGWQGTVTTLEALRSIVHALRGWATPLGAAINTSTPAFDAEGNPTDERVAFQLTTVGQEVMQFARMRLAAMQPSD
jgi:FMN reductase